MNKTYRTVWNETTGTYVAAQETAKGRGKKSSTSKLISSAFGVAGVIGLSTFALPASATWTGDKDSCGGFSAGTITGVRPTPTP
jgi:trimeric autotransporter adhesin